MCIKSEIEDINLNFFTFDGLFFMLHTVHCLRPLEKSSKVRLPGILFLSLVALFYNPG